MSGKLLNNLISYWSVIIVHWLQSSVNTYTQNRTEQVLGQLQFHFFLYSLKHLTFPNIALTDLTHMPSKTIFKLRAVTSMYCCCRSAMNVYCWSLFGSLFSVICIIKCSLLNIMLHFQAYKHIDIHTHNPEFKKNYITITWVKMYILIHVEGVALPTSINRHLGCVDT